MLEIKNVRAIIAGVGIALMLAVNGCSDSKNVSIDTSDGVTNILDYVSVSFDGANGEGTALVNVE